MASGTSKRRARGCTSAATNRRPRMISKSRTDRGLRTPRAACARRAPNRTGSASFLDTRPDLVCAVVRRRDLVRVDLQWSVAGAASVIGDLHQRVAEIILVIAIGKLVAHSRQRIL